tara:strand:+ start:1940 stop:2248 length:309 start_codon:yes stop_codon:yes gene_type:complete
MNTAKIGIQAPPKSGARYTRGGITHQSSAGGQYPATDTGFLVANIAYMVTNFVGRVTSSAPYSKYLEYGTTSMSARPFMFPSLEKNRMKILNMFKAIGLLRR